MANTNALRTSLLALALLGGCTNATATNDAGTADANDVDAGSGPVDSGPRPDVGTDAFVPRDVGAYTRIPEATAEAGRTGCMYDRGAWPWETLGEEVPIGDQIPIRHFILLMQENRSFDHYFGTMPGVDGIPAGAFNPRADGTHVEPFHTTTYCTVDTNHEWTGSHLEYNGGANDGFVTQNDPMGERAMGYFDRTDIPFYWDLAERFAISDHHHCSMLGPTWTNREYYLSGTSFGQIENVSIPSERYTVGADGDHIIMQALDRAGVSWHVYYTTVPFVWGAYSSWALRPEQRSRMSNVSSFYDDLASGNVASVVWIDPSWTTSGTTTTDEHPPADPQFGQAWVRDVIQHVMDSPIWNDTAIILTYDEHGGFYDHVPPPAACPPDGFAPELGAHDFDAQYDRLGFRVPLMVVSPHARQHYVSNHVTDHASVLRLLEARFLMPAMTARDANAWPLTDMFDFASTNPTRSSDLAAAPIDEAQRMACARGTF